jgi:2-dehydropantoate 2-reductase
MSFENPKTVVVGAGAMGGLFGGLLAEGGLDVTLVDAWPEHIAAIRRDGLRIVGVGGDRFIKVKATADAREIDRADVVLFQCKAFANAAAANSAKHLFGGQTVAITFQNGLGNEQALGAILGAQNVLGGLTAQAGLAEEAGVVRNFGDLPTYIGEMAGGLSERAVAIAKAFTAHGLPVSASADIKRDKWKKLLGNVALGAISAVTDMRSVEIMRIPELQEIVFRAVDEAAEVAKHEGVALDVKEAREVLMRLVDPSGGGTGNSKSSMREDIIHGAVVRLARQHKVATPTIDTMVAMVKGLQSQYLPQ